MQPGESSRPGRTDADQVAARVAAAAEAVRAVLAALAPLPRLLLLQLDELVRARARVRELEDERDRLRAALNETPAEGGAHV